MYVVCKRHPAATIYTCHIFLLAAPCGTALRNSKHPQLRDAQHQHTRLSRSCTAHILAAQTRTLDVPRRSYVTTWMAPIGYMASMPLQVLMTQFWGVKSVKTWLRNHRKKSLMLNIMIVARLSIMRTHSTTGPTKSLKKPICSDRHGSGATALLGWHTTELQQVMQ